MDDYNFKWKTFSKHLDQTFRDLLEDKRFANVTLVCDDQRQIKAHKFVLSACSPVFKSVLDNNTGESNPLVILRGIHYDDMEAILQFMYQGETSVKKERMQDFMKAAEDLEVKIISRKYRKEKETVNIGDSGKSPSPKQIRNEASDKKETDENPTKEITDAEDDFEDDQNMLIESVDAEDNQILPIETLDAEDDFKDNQNMPIETVDAEYDVEDDQSLKIETNETTDISLGNLVEEVIFSERNETEVSKTPKKGLTVQDLMELAFGKSSLNKTSEHEVETLKEGEVKKETEDFSQIIIEGENDVFHGQPLGGTMDEDNKPHSSEEKPVGDFKYLIKRESDSLLGERREEDIKSDNIKKKKMIRQGEDFSRVTAVSGKTILVCRKCEFQSNNLTTIRRHIKYDHQGEVSFSCDFCVYETNRKATMKLHVKKMHPMTFSCEKCDYIGKWERDLNSHIRMAHSTDDKDDEPSFPCEECPYVGKKKCNLKAHIRLAHSTDATEYDEQSFPCENCDYVGKKKCNLKSHMRHCS